MDPAVVFILSTGLKAAVALLAFAFLAHVVPFALDKFGLRQYPGPLLAKLSDIWLGWYTAHGKINQAVWNAHRAYGMPPDFIALKSQSRKHLPVALQVPLSALPRIMFLSPMRLPSTRSTVTVRAF